MKVQWLFFILLFPVIIGKIYNSDLTIGSSILTPYIYVCFTHKGYDKKKVYQEHICYGAWDFDIRKS